MQTTLGRKKNGQKKAKIVSRKTQKSRAAGANPKKQRAAVRRALKKNPANGVYAHTMTPAQMARDPRRIQSTDSSLALSSQQSTIPQIVDIQLTGIYAFSSAFITKALERGFAGTATAPWIAYFAWLYMANILVQFVTGGTPTAQQLPYFLLAIGRALSKKTVPFKLSKMSFAGQTSWNQFNPNTVVGFAPYGFVLSYETVPATPTFVNMFPLVTQAGWAAYDDMQGQNAFTQLCAFMENNVGDKEIGRLCRNVPVSITSTSLDSDVSAFAVLRQSQGVGWTGPSGGGINGIAQLEVPLFSPLLSLLNATQGTISPGFVSSRAPVHDTAVAGDQAFLGLAMSSFLSESKWGMKKYPYFKPVDFLQFGDVVAQWVSSIVQAFINDSVNEATWTNAQDSLKLSLPCPITLQEMLLLLRNVLMQAFKDTQSGVGSIYPYVPSSGTDNQFVPFIAGAPTCFLSAIDMHLPMPLIENIRALVTRHVGPTETNCQYWVPVLGQYALTTLHDTDYSITFPADSTGGPAESQSVFKSGLLFRTVAEVKTDTKPRAGSLSTTTATTLLAETPISLIDGSCTPGIAAINDPQRLKVLCSLWNDWLTGSGIQTYSVGCGTLGTEKGISLLASVPMTRHFVRLSAEHVAARQKQMTDIRLETPHAKRMMASPFSFLSAVADTSHGVILAAAYEQILSTWILPINEIEFSGDDPFNSTLLVRWQGIMGEGNLSPLTSGTDGQLISTMNATYAAKMTKGRTTEKSDWSQLFETMAASGRGGILSSMVAGLVGNFVPGLSGIANTIANSLPI